MKGVFTIFLSLYSATFLAFLKIAFPDIISFVYLIIASIHVLYMFAIISGLAIYIEKREAHHINSLNF